MLTFLLKLTFSNSKSLRPAFFPSLLFRSLKTITPNNLKPTLLKTIYTASRGPNSSNLCIRSVMSASNRNKRPASEAKKSANSPKVSRRNDQSGTAVLVEQLSIDQPLENMENDNNVAIEILDIPDKSASDKKEYRTIKLPNGLTALLISDPSPIEPKTVPEAATSETEDSDDEESESDDEDDTDEKEKLAACSLCIDVGSFSDPRDIQGLAHFLEHMIFMGSEKYPSENEFDQYIKKCGGSDNAHTNCEETQFYFEVAEEHLDGAFDRFAALFRVPLMLKEAMTREREAVESEFSSKMQNDSVRKEQLLSGLGQAEHPSSIFTWGNLKTLKDGVASDEVLYERVHAFQKRHYSAHRMYLAVQARLPLDVLQSMVIRHWSDIPNNGLGADDFTRFNATNAFQDVFNDHVFVVKPVANQTKLEVTFCLESLLKEYECKPHHFVSYLLGYEGTGSLCAYLRNKLYALDLVAGADDVGFDSNSLYSLFGVTIYLTQKGFENVDAVIDAIFSYLRFMQQAGPQEALFRELQTIEENNFRFKTDQTAMENVEELAINLKYYPPKHLFTADSLYMRYDPEAIQRVLDALNGAKMNVMITSKNTFDGHSFDTTEPWFGTEYCSVPFPEKWQKMWREAKPFAEFALPPPNPFITTDFSILYDKENDKVPELPQNLLQTEKGELWFRQDDRFLLPIAFYYFYFASPVARGTAENDVMMALYSMLLKYKLVERLYPAAVAGMGYECYSSEKGLVLKVNGYNQNLHQLIETFSAALTNFTDDLTEEQFNTFVEQKLREYYNAIIKPKSFAKVLRFGIVESVFVPTLTKFEHIKSVTLANFKRYATCFLKEMRVQALLQGNLNAEQASSIMSNVLSTLNCAAIQDITPLTLRTHEIPVGAAYIRCPTMNDTDVNTVVANYYQIGPISIRLNCLLDLLLLIAEEPVFDILRSKEQLGYDVDCGMRDNYGILGYTISVNSQEHKFESEFVDERIEAFRTELVNIIAKISEEDFAQFKDTMIKLKLTDDNHLKDELVRNWAEVTSDEYIFDRHRKEVECLRKITREEFTEFYRQHYEHGTRKLSIQVIGNKEACREGSGCKSEEEEPESIFKTTFKELTFVELAKPEKGFLIRNIEEYRRGLTVLPVAKTF